MRHSEGCSQHPVGATGESKPGQHTHFHACMGSAGESSYTHVHIRDVETEMNDPGGKPQTRTDSVTACQLVSFGCSMATVMPASVNTNLHQMEPHSLL